MRKTFLCTAAIVLSLPALAQIDAISLLEARYKPHLPAGDESAWQLKLASIGQSRYVFWRGTKDLFFDWSRTALADWRNSNPESWVTCHGDIHLGNLGTYPISINPPKIGAGLVDYDDADRLPPEYDLLEIAITLMLIAEEQKLPPAAAQAAIAEGLGAYSAALGSDTNIAAMLAGEKPIVRLLAENGRAAADAEIAELTNDGKFVQVVRSKAGKVKELLSPMSQTDALAASIFDAAGRSDSLAVELGNPKDAAAVRAVIVDAAWRTRAGSSGSQGLRKLLVLVNAPAGKRLVYLKQVIPSPAARAELVALRPQPARRVAAAVAAGAPGWAGSTGTTLLGKEYWISLKDPWSDELNHEDIESAADLMTAGRMMGLATARLHAATARERAELRGRVWEALPEGTAAPASGRVRPQLLEQITDRAGAYIAYQNAAYDRLKNDDRYEDAVKAVKKLLTPTK